MNNAWRRIEKSLGVAAPECVSSLNPPASEKELEKLRKGLDVEVPEQLFQYLSIHNGQKELYVNEMLFEGNHLLSVDEIVSLWNMYNEVAASLVDEDRSEGDVKKWWDHIFIPITDDNGNSYCINSITGEIYYHNNSDGMVGPISMSLLHWFTKIADLLEKNDYIVEHGSVWFNESLF